MYKKDHCEFCGARGPDVKLRMVYSKFCFCWQCANGAPDRGCGIMFATDGIRRWYCTLPYRHKGPHRQDNYINGRYSCTFLLHTFCPNQASITNPCIQTDGWINNSQFIESVGSRHLLTKLLTSKVNTSDTYHLPPGFVNQLCSAGIGRLYCTDARETAGGLVHINFQQRTATATLKNSTAVSVATGEDQYRYQHQQYVFDNCYWIIVTWVNTGSGYTTVSEFSRSNH